MVESKMGVWSKRLKDPNPQVRLKAIESLETLGGADALALLGETFATDPEPQVRQLAQKAGKVIYYNLHRQAQVAQAEEAERRRAAEILAQAQVRKQGRQ